MDSRFFFTLGQLIVGYIVTVGTAIIIRDTGWYLLNIPTKDQTKTTKICYDFLEQMRTAVKDDTMQHAADYSEALFGSDFDKTIDQATKDKFLHIFNWLELKAGDTVLDAGCGSGKWLYFLKERGVKAIGLTLSPEQERKGKENGLDVRTLDYRVIFNIVILSINEWKILFTCSSNRHLSSAYLISSVDE